MTLTTNYVPGQSGHVANHNAIDVAINAIVAQLAAGGAILTGTGAPDDANGVDGDVYFDFAGGMAYGPKAAGTWPAGVAIGGGGTVVQTTSELGGSGPAVDVTPGTLTDILPSTTVHQAQSLSGLMADDPAGLLRFDWAADGSSSTLIAASEVGLISTEVTVRLPVSTLTDGDRVHVLDGSNVVRASVEYRSTLAPTMAGVTQLQIVAQIGAATPGLTGMQFVRVFIESSNATPVPVTAVVTFTAQAVSSVAPTAYYVPTLTSVALASSTATVTFPAPATDADLYGFVVELQQTSGKPPAVSRGYVARTSGDMGPVAIDLTTVTFDVALVSGDIYAVHIYPAASTGNGADVTASTNYTAP